MQAIKHKLEHLATHGSHDTSQDPSEILSPVLISYAKDLSTDTDDYLRRLCSHDFDALQPVTTDLSYPLSHYFISSSHNTYLAGHQLYGQASVVPYQHVLERSCRCVEIDVWDGVGVAVTGAEQKPRSNRSSLIERLHSDMLDLKLRHHKEPGPIRVPTAPLPEPAMTEDTIKPLEVNRIEPRVLHGHTATKEVPFRDVCRAIRDSAFRTSDLPIIVSLEIHTSPEQQQRMVDIMNDEWGQYLLDKSLKAANVTALPPLENLRRKILIKVKYTTPKAEPAVGSSTYTTEDEDSSADEAQIERVHKGNIIESLGSMGVYTRSCHFHSFSQPEASLPGHVFAISEQKVKVQLADCATAFGLHNQKYLMRIYPKGVRIASSNLDPLPLWRCGVQMVALNWQYVNAPIMLNHALFDGTPGWVLKPEYLWPAPALETDEARQQRSRESGTISLTIELLAAQGIELTKKHTRPYVKCELHLERRVNALERFNSGSSGVDNAKIRYTATSEHGKCRAQGVDFQRQLLNFDSITGVVRDLSFVRLKVKNAEGYKKDDLLGWACFRYDRLLDRVRTIRLYDGLGHETDGFLLVNITKKFTADFNVTDGD